MLSDEDKTWLIGQIEGAQSSFNERLEGLETKLLTAFHRWSSPVEMRARTHAAAIKALDAEMEAVQDRVAKLEGGR